MSEQTPLEKWADAIRLARSTGMMPGIVEIADYAASLEAELATEKGVAEARRQIAGDLEQLHDALIEKYNALEAQLAEARGEWQPMDDGVEIRGSECVYSFFGDHAEVTNEWMDDAVHYGPEFAFCERRLSQPEPIMQEAADQERTAAAWPQGEQAAEELAAADWATWGEDISSHKWVQLPAYYRRERTQRFAAALARLNEQPAPDAEGTQGVPGIVTAAPPETKAPASR